MYWERLKEENEQKLPGTVSHKKHTPRAYLRNNHHVRSGRLTHLLARSCTHREKEVRLLVTKPSKNSGIEACNMQAALYNIYCGAVKLSWSGWKLGSGNVRGRIYGVWNVCGWGRNDAGELFGCRKCLGVNVWKKCPAKTSRERPYTDAGLQVNSVEVIICANYTYIQWNNCFFYTKEVRTNTKNMSQKHWYTLLIKIIKTIFAASFFDLH